MPKGAANWRQAADDFEIKEPCDIISKLWATQAVILEQLGRKEDAGLWRKRAEEPVTEDYPDVYALFHGKLSVMMNDTNE